MADAVAAADTAMHNFAPHEALAQLWRIVESVNGYITEQEPWVLAKDETQAERLDAVLYTSLDALRALAVTLSPFMPATTEKLWVGLGADHSLGALHDQIIPEAGSFGALPSGSAIAELAALFPRIEQDS
jgi:methionyl-tRNA synthetase